MLQLDNKWPFVATFTCLNGYYAFPDQTRVLGEDWLLEPAGGAIANITPASIDFYSSQQAFALEFMEIMTRPGGSTRPDTVGSVLTATRVNFQARHPELSITNREYLLFGDPDSSHTINISGSVVGPFGDLFKIY